MKKTECYESNSGALFKDELSALEVDFQAAYEADKPSTYREKWAHQVYWAKISDAAKALEKYYAE